MHKQKDIGSSYLEKRRGDHVSSIVVER